jgi:hypothetical protein
MRGVYGGSGSEEKAEPPMAKVVFGRDAYGAGLSAQ